LHLSKIDFTEKAAGCADYLDFTRLKFALFCLPRDFFRETQKLIVVLLFDIIFV